MPSGKIMTDVLQDKVIVVLDVMLQRIGLVSGMESNRELTALRVEISLRRCHSHTSTQLSYVPSLNTPMRLITDGHGVFEEDIGL